MNDAAEGARFLCVGLGYHRHIYRVMVHNIVRFLNAVGEPYTLNRSDDAIYLHRKNQEILFGSALDPDTLEGTHELVGCWIDEGGLMTRHAWEVVQRRTGQYDASILVTTIPYFEGWIKTDIYDPWHANGEKDDEEITYIHTRTIDNPAYSRREIERARRNLPAHLFASIYLGEWAKPFGLIYPEPADGYVMVDPFEIPVEWPIFAGHDWGWTDYTTGIWAALDPNTDTLYGFAEYEDNFMPIEQHVQVWKNEILTDYPVKQAWGDPTAPATWNTCAAMGYPVDNAEADFRYGVSCVTDRLQSGRLKMFNGMGYWRDYRARYLWAEDPKDSQKLLEKEKPRQKAAHLMDAKRYLCAGIASAGWGPEPPVILRRGQGVS